jgi:hypothetical protein
MIRITGSPVNRYEIYTVAILPYQRGYIEAQKRDYIYYIRDNRISRTEKGEIASGQAC